MSITDIAATGWTAFWNNICSAGTLGISMSMLNPLINWLLEIVHAPVYLPEA